LKNLKICIEILKNYMKNSKKIFTRAYILGILGKSTAINNYVSRLCKLDTIHGIAMFLYVHNITKAIST